MIEYKSTETNPRVVWKKYDKPVEKNYKQVEKGDVLLIEHGDYDNYVRVIFDHIEFVEMGWIKTVGVYLIDNAPYAGYHVLRDGVNDFYVIGKVVK